MSAKSASERALQYLRKAPRITLQDLRDNPGARTQGRQVSKAHNRVGKSQKELSGAAKPPLGWIWGDFFKPWQRIYPGQTHFNQDINLRREYPPLSLLELQRLIDLGWLDPSLPIDLTTLCNTGRYRCDPAQRQFGVQLTDEGADVWTSRVDLEVQWASETSVAAVERTGGLVTTAYYDPISLTAAVSPLTWFENGRPIPSRAVPPLDLLSYYTDANKRGYLADVEELKKARVQLALKMGYTLPDDDFYERTLACRRRPTQVFLGLQPGSVVSLADRTVLRPVDHKTAAYYSGADGWRQEVR